MFLTWKLVIVPAFCLAVLMALPGLFVGLVIVALVCLIAYLVLLFLVALCGEVYRHLTHRKEPS